MRIENHGRTEYSFTELCASTLRGILCTLFLFQSVCCMCRGFSGWEIPLSINVQMQALLLTVVVLYELTPLCKKYRPYASILIEILGFLGAGLYLCKHYGKLESGQQALYSDYIRYWNHYYGTNYIGYASDKYLLLFLSALIFSVFLVAVIFRYITGIRLFLLLPGIAALASGLLVNVCPNWLSLCLFFIGALLVYSGPGKKSKIVFHAKDNKKHRFQQNATCISVSFVVLALGIGIVFTASTFFSKAAANIPEKNPEFIKVQMSLEDRIKSLEKSGISFSSDWAHVDNHTPEYSGEKVLSIYASIKPATSLYMKDFCSGTYENGKWQKEGNRFEKEARQAGCDANLGTFLHQLYLENMDAGYLNMDAGYLNNGEIVADYRIEYESVFSKSAYVPYFTDLSKTGDDAWVEDDGPVNKKRGVKSLKVTGLTENTGDSLYSTARVQEAGHDLAWYTEYATKYYQNGAKDVPALNDYVKEIKQKYQKEYGAINSGLFDSTSTVLYENMKRKWYAELVRDELGKNADYNLYLDEIPDNTDTIQYFLESGHEGYCMHFASAGTLILQELGIPARYASGYIAKSNAFTKEGEGYQAEILDRNAHAWTEIYLETIGWVPFEMTPAYQLVAAGLPTDENRLDTLKKQHEERNLQENQDNSVQESEKEELETEKNTETEPSESESQTEQNGTDNDKNSNNKWSDGENTTKKYVLICLFTGLAFLVFLTGGFYAFSRRYGNILAQDLKNERNRRAVKRINYRIYKTLWSVRTLTDEEYLEKLIQKYPLVSDEEWKNYMKIIQKATYSKEEITREEAAFCYKCYRRRKKK